MTADTMGPDGPIPGGIGSNAWRVRRRERRLVHHQTVDQETHIAPIAAKTYRANGLLAADRPSPQRSEARPHVLERAEFRPAPPPLAIRHQCFQQVFPFEDGSSPRSLFCSLEGLQKVVEYVILVFFVEEMWAVVFRCE